MRNANFLQLKVKNNCFYLKKLPLRHNKQTGRAESFECDMQSYEYFVFIFLLQGSIHTRLVMHLLAFLLLTFGALNSALSEGKNITFMDNFLTIIVIRSSNKKQLIYRTCMDLLHALHDYKYFTIMRLTCCTHFTKFLWRLC